MSIIQPYLKYISLFILLFFYFVFLIVFYKIIFKDPKLKDWFIKSLTDQNTGGASGKSLMALMFSKIIAFAAIISVIWTPTHLMPDYYFITIMSFIAAVYSIKLAGKFASNNDSLDTNNTDTKITEQTNTNTNTQTVTQTTTPNPTTTTTPNQTTNTTTNQTTTTSADNTVENFNPKP